MIIRQSVKVWFAHARYDANPREFYNRNLLVRWLGMLRKFTAVKSTMSLLLVFFSSFSGVAFCGERDLGRLEPFGIYVLDGERLVTTSSTSLFRDKLGDQPTCVLFARPDRSGLPKPDIMRLVQQIDDLTAKMSFNTALVLLDDNRDVDRLRDRFRNVKLAYSADGKNGPKPFRIKAESELTILIWSKRRIQSRLEFRDFSSKEIPRVMNEIFSNLR